MILPKANNVETVALLSKLHEAKHHVNVKLDMDELDLTSADRSGNGDQQTTWHFGYED